MRRFMLLPQGERNLSMPKQGRLPVEEALRIQRWIMELLTVACFVLKVEGVR